MTFPILRIVSSSVIGLFLLSCSALDNKMDQAVLSCGPEALDGNAYYVKILDSEGNELNPSSRESLSVDYAIQGQTQPVKITSKACVELPNAEGDLAVSAPGLQQSWAESLKLSAHLQYLKLKAYPEIISQLNCPSSGIFAHDRATNVWDIQVKGDAQALDFEIVAIHEGDQSVHSLFRKARGQSDLTIPAHFDSSSLSEGVYRYEARYGLAAESWKRPLSLSGPMANCPLTIIHARPTLELFDDPSHTVKPGALFPWASESKNSEVLYCFSQRTGTKEQNACDAEGSCADPRNFRTGLIKAPEVSGVYDLIVMARSKNGLDGERACRTIAVSAKAPRFQVKWTRKSWQDGLASFELPYTHIGAKISLAADNPSTFDRKLSCKVDFLLRGTDPFATERVKCAAGVCKGMAMNRFVPCEEDISIALEKIWELAELNDSRLRLHVRSDDGAGNYEDVVKEAWISRSLWDITDLKTKDAGIDDGNDSFYELSPLPTGGIFVHARSKNRVWENGAWTEVKEPEGPGYGDLLFSPSGDVWLYRQGKLEDGSPFFKVFLLGDKSWQLKHEAKEVFLSLNPDAADGVFIRSTNSFVQVTPRETRLWPEPAKDGQCSLNRSGGIPQRSTLAHDQLRDEVYALCGHQFLRLSSAKGMEILHEFPAKYGYNYLVLDQDDRVLITLQGNLGSGIPTRFLIFSRKEGSLREGSLAGIKERIDGPTADISGRIVLGEKLWMPETETWASSEDIFSIFPYNSSRYNSNRTYGSYLNFLDAEGIYLLQGEDPLYFSNQLMDMPKFVLYHPFEKSYYLSGKSNDRHEIKRIQSLSLLHISREQLGVRKKAHLEFSNNYHDPKRVIFEFDDHKKQYEVRNGKVEHLPMPYDAFTGERRDDFASQRVFLYRNRDVLIHRSDFLEYYKADATEPVSLDAGFPSPGEPLEDAYGRAWYSCFAKDGHPNGRRYSLCGLKGTDLAIYPLFPDDDTYLRLSFFMQNKFVMILQDGRVFTKDLDNEQAPIDVAPEFITQGAFALKDVKSIIRLRDDSLLFLVKASEDLPSHTAFHLNTATLAMSSFDFPGLVNKYGEPLSRTFDVDAEGQYLGLFEDGLYKRVAGQWIRLIAHSDLDKALRKEGESIESFRFEVASGRIFIRTKSLELLVYEPQED